MIAPPPSRRDGVVDTLHGVEVPDPYRWLEDGESPEVHRWVAEQNAHTRQALDARPDRGWWHGRLVALMQLPVVGAVQVRDGHLVCFERPAGAEQFLLTRRSAGDPDTAALILVDPAVGTTDSANAVDWFEASVDGALVAVGTSEGGTEDSVLRVLETADGRDLGEAIPNTRACSVAWEPDGAGFVYTRYPEGDRYHRTVYHHRLGDGWEDDPVLWAEHPDAQAWPSVTLSPDGAWLLVHVQVGWARVDVHVLERSTGAWTTIVEGVEARSSFEFAASGDALVGVTTLDASRGRVVGVPLDAVPAPDDWPTIVAEGEAVVSGLRVWGDELLVVGTTRAVDTVRRYDAAGRSLGEVAGLGDVVAVAGLSADRAGGPAFVVIDSFDAPTSVWRVSGDGPAERWSAAPAASTGVVPDLTVSQVGYESLDATSIGLFLIHRSDVVPSSDVPMILNGYGGFAISETPVWSPQVAAWCAAGGTYAIAGLRGGLEDGEAWHQAGRRALKQNVFDDFHAAGDWLVERGYAGRDRLAVHGGSNGGLLVGVAMTQRPDLCRAVWCRVPLLDMVRFPQFLIARLWTSEYGDPDIAEEFAWVHAYSPYHRVAQGTCYPATLFMTAEGDSRVDPLHARKMAALVQAATSCPDERPILLFQEDRAGHGVGKPVAKRADELADGLTFLGWQLALHATAGR